MLKDLKSYRSFLYEHWDRCPELIKPKIKELDKKIKELKKGK